jgi:hypothetical protein
MAQCRSKTTINLVDSRFHSQIRTGHLPSANLERYCHTSSLEKRLRPQDCRVNGS